MENLKNRMYNYETPAPEGVWESIVAELDSSNVVVMPASNKRKTLYYALAAAAAVAILIFSFIFFRNNSSKTEKEIATSPANTDNKTIMKVPDTEDKNSSREIAKNVSPPNEIKKPAKIKAEESKEASKHIDIAASNPQYYITIAGPQGQPVKVSSKVAALIVSSDDSYPPKPIWNKKIEKWKDIMNTNTLAATPDNFLDIVELNNALKQKSN